MTETLPHDIPTGRATQDPLKNVRAQNRSRTAARHAEATAPIAFIEWADRMHGPGKPFSSRSHVWEYALARFIVEREGQEVYDALLRD